MQMERERRNNGGIGEYGDRSLLMESSSKSSSILPPLPSSPPSSSLIGSASGCVGVGGGSYIVHHVSKFDTLAGVAIKYGVEVADIKRINGLVTDLQMFALKSLNIPLPGRHPPSPILSNGHKSQGTYDDESFHRPSSSEQTPPNRRHSDLYDSLQSLKLKPSPQRKVSSAMSSLQGYYGLKTPEKKSAPDGFEMTIYRKGSADDRDEHLPFSSPPPSHHRKCKSIGNGLSENGDLGESLLGAETEETELVRWFDKLRRRQKSEADSNAHTPGKLLKEESSGSCGFSASAGKGLALRPKAAAVTSRGGSGTDFDSGFPTNFGDYVVVDNSGGVRKSSSTSSLQDTDNGSGSSIWPTSRWSLKPDLQALSTAAITRPIFDGLPKPITGRRNKTAVD